jgi:hypothetical protein
MDYMYCPRCKLLQNDNGYDLCDDCFDVDMAEEERGEDNK